MVISKEDALFKTRPKLRVCFLEISQLNEFYLYPVAFGASAVVLYGTPLGITFFSFEDFV